MDNKLPILPIFLEALSFSVKHYRVLLKVGLPLLITHILFAVFSHFVAIDFANPLLVILTVVFVVAYLLSSVMAVVGCHRIYLLGSDVVEKEPILNWTGNEIKYAGWWVLVGLCAMLIAIPLMLVIIPVFMSSSVSVFENQNLLIAIIAIIDIPIYYIVSRCSLVLPSSAIGVHGKQLSWSWKLSSGNAWRLTLLIGSLPILTNLIYDFLPAFTSLLPKLFLGICFLIIGAVEVILLSISYRFLVHSEENEY